MISMANRVDSRFRSFPPCGVHEAVCILDRLVNNTPDTQPDIIQADTRSQNAPVFTLARPLIKVQPHARCNRQVIDGVQRESSATVRNSGSSSCWGD
ncbi:hypothetical protein D9M68_138090 [compost metagenome]